jgi:intraflagellar transport protein 52
MMDDYFDLEENSKIFDFMLKFLLTDEVDFDFGRDDADKASSAVVPDIAGLADGIKSCFQ